MTISSLIFRIFIWCLPFSCTFSLFDFRILKFVLRTNGTHLYCRLWILFDLIIDWLIDWFFRFFEKRKTALALLRRGSNGKLIKTSGFVWNLNNRKEMCKSCWTVKKLLNSADSGKKCSAGGIDRRHCEFSLEMRWNAAKKIIFTAYFLHLFAVNCGELFFFTAFSVAKNYFFSPLDAINYFFSRHLAVKKNNSPLERKRWIIFFHR